MRMSFKRNFLQLKRGTIFEFGKSSVQYIFNGERAGLFFYTQIDRSTKHSGLFTTDKLMVVNIIGTIANYYDWLPKEVKVKSFEKLYADLKGTKYIKIVSPNGLILVIDGQLSKKYFTSFKLDYYTLVSITYGINKKWSVLYLKDSAKR